jgi:HD superfamily phosphohydrolase YqeK
VQQSALLEAAARGELPPWAHVSRQRLAHMERVAELLGDWAAGLKLSPAEQRRWRAAGLLHDALRDHPPEELRHLVPENLRTVGGKLLHGPAAAERLRADGVADEPLLLAISFHSIGHPDLDELGRALFIADYIEPGRRYDPAKLAVLRARMPASRTEVLLEVLQTRMARLLGDGRPIRSETAAFWNRLNAARNSHVAQ